MDRTASNRLAHSLSHECRDLFCTNRCGNEQHPLVYKLSSAWDSLTAESDEGIGVRELRRLDPSFSVEDWKRDIQELFLPEFMSAFLRVRERRTD